jgi:hypothetical protein
MPSPKPYATGCFLKKLRGTVGAEPHALGVASRQDAEAVLLDLMDPVGTVSAGLWRVTAGKARQGRPHEGYAAT